MKTKPPRRICIDNTSFLPIVGGTETYCYQLLKSVPANTANLKLVCEVPLEGVEELNEHPVMRFGRISSISGYEESEIIDKSYGLGRVLLNSTEASRCLERVSEAGFCNYYEELFKHKPEIILINDFMRVPCAPYLQIAPLINDSKLIINLHGILTSFKEFWEEFPEKKKFAIDFIKNYPKNIYYIAPSKYVYREALEWGIKKENLRHIYIGVDTHIFTPAFGQEKLKKKNAVLAKLNLPPLGENEILIGFPSRAVDHKGIDVALAGLGEIARKDKAKKFKFLIAGGSSDNPEGLVDIQELIKQSGVSERVILGIDAFVEYPESMIGFYQACDLCLFPSRRDALGYGAIESMACGIPVIGTSIPGLSEALGIEVDRQGDCPGGWAIINDDSQSLAAQIDLVLNNPAILQSKGLEAREWVERSFNLTKMIEEHLDFFEQVSPLN